MPISDEFLKDRRDYYALVKHRKNGLGGTKRRVLAIAGVQVNLTVEEKDPDSLLKEQEFRGAVEFLARCKDFTLPDKLHLYLTAEGSSAGYLDSGRDDGAKWRVFLGKSSTKHVPVGPPIQGVPDDVRGGRGATPNRIVGDQLYEAVLASAPANLGATAQVQVLDQARRARIRATVFHELGHVLHAASCPERFNGLVDEELLNRQKKAPLEISNMHAFIRKVSKKVSAYAMTHPNEFVAETFSGLMSHLAYDDEVIDTYMRCGGPLGLAGTTRVGTSTQGRALYRIRHRGLQFV
ncbi:hypothetical protein [Melittangium boletus]|uniref:hypothetical protein n=1 Tax=Melittangium boletus TaxID=83453 RepID=UPI003DA60A2E